MSPLPLPGPAVGASPQVPTGEQVPERRGHESGGPGGRCVPGLEPVSWV